ncbi:hypothetical protein K458DRAFT_301633 [Lentithecium fluviatile CBS 122367]|uniref:Zn(2)-C6 fungal-type domain-containing protein n=1 Tax=Lentithecium fluviatile CBS 122367 TaxID=1168545 RepID=A0A6G1J342_9PLEO|nr:hypothetical protein K458DRAFT_301633 [Lentithecium fluviatile CBS 122367]
MPRPKKPGAGEPKRRSRNGCWPCKARKVKCGEEKPRCTNCERQGETCDYSIRLNWGGRTKREHSNAGSASGASSSTGSPYMGTLSFDEDVLSPLFPPGTPEAPRPRKTYGHGRSHSATSVPTSNPSSIDPDLVRMSQAQSHPVFAVEEAFDQNVYSHQSQDLRASASLDARQYLGAFDYPSPAASNFESLNFSTANFPPMTADSPPSMPPPVRNSSYSTPNSRQYVEYADSIHSRHKRSYSAESPATSDAYSPQPGPPTPFSPFMTMPLTPNSSVGTDDPVLRTASTQSGTQYPPPAPDLRRMSVQSLLAQPSGNGHQHGRQYPIGDEKYTTYGYDLGLPDLDTPHNDDLNAIAIFSPPSGTMDLDDESIYGRASKLRSKDMAFESGGYYAKPVPIKISRALEPLPPLLLENPMNLLYFHHFLNHTARILVPHDCERNPFRQILPEMAVKDDNIMSLLLAYSASHRARMLAHAEPANRIAIWVRDVFPKLRQSLATAHHPSDITNSTLAPAIMMASLEIISPNTFEVPISWQNHLTMARQMIITRGGPRSMDRADHAAYFLSRWFAYLDVLGSLSGNKNDQPLGSFYWSSENASADEDFQIDCLTGFTNRCVGSLARIAELAKQVEPFRLDAAGNIRDDYRPSAAVVAQADAIRADLEEGLSGGMVYKGCNHRSHSTSESEGAWDAIEIYATNEMFHWAGLIHLYRRVLNLPSSHASVQNAVREIIGLLYKVRRGSTAEACLLFPMFAAGCDARDQGQREKIMERLRCVEGFGMVQVRRARGLMQRVWDTGRAWESLVEGEFFG